MTLLYPKWMPGYHSPQNPIELFAGLEIRGGDVLLDWRRDAVEVYAFHIDVPATMSGCTSLAPGTRSTWRDGARPGAPRRAEGHR